MRLLASALRFRVAVIFGLTLAGATWLMPDFLSLTTLSVGLDRAASTGLVATGLTVLLIGGQIDLSGGAVLAVSGIVAIMAEPSLGVWPASAAGVLAGAAAGALNGFLAVRCGVNSLIATLATMLVYRSTAHWLTDSQPLAGTDMAVSLALTDAYFDAFTPRSLLFVVSIVLLHVWLTRTVAGRSLFAVGSSAAAAQASGIASSRITLLGFVFAGAMAGLAGVLQSLATNTGSPVFGADLTVAVIAAVVVGGTRLEGGRGSAMGTLGGVLTMAALTTAMEFESVPAYLQQVVSGLILILLVVLDRTVRTKRRVRGLSPARA